MLLQLKDQHIYKFITLCSNSHGIHPQMLLQLLVTACISCILVFIWFGNSLQLYSENQKIVEKKDDFSTQYMNWNNADYQTHV